MKLIATLTLILFFTTAQSATIDTQANTYTASKKAHSIAESSIIVDGHIDVPYRLEDGWVDVTKATKGGDFDYPRAKSGGLNAPFMSIYTPASLDGTNESTALAHKLIDFVEAIVGRAPEKFAIATSTRQLKKQFSAGKISLPLGMENGSPIQLDLKNLKVFYDRGVRYITLAHSKTNAISDSSYDEMRQWGGLSKFGEQVVGEMNRLGIMVDISHVSDEAFYDVMKITKVPVIASHSSLRTFTPGFERNMDDQMIKALAKNGGVIMINFGSTFVDAKAREWSDQQSKDLKLALEKFGSKESLEYIAYSDAYRDSKPLPFADLDNVLEHIDYAVKLVGIDYVGLGSDFDGVGDSLPVGLKDVSTYPNLVQGLLDRDYSKKDIKKILGENLIRVWEAAEAFADSAK